MDYERKILDAHKTQYRINHEMKLRARQIGVPVEDYERMIQNINKGMDSTEALTNMYGFETKMAFESGYDNVEDYLWTRLPLSVFH